VCIVELIACIDCLDGRVCSDVVKDLRFEDNDKDLKSEDKDFGNFSFSRFGFICRETDRITEADDRCTHTTTRMTLGHI